LDTFAKEFVALPMVADGRILAQFGSAKRWYVSLAVSLLAPQWHRPGADLKRPERINDVSVHRR